MIVTLSCSLLDLGKLTHKRPQPLLAHIKLLNITQQDHGTFISMPSTIVSCLVGGRCRLALASVY